MPDVSRLVARQDFDALIPHVLKLGTETDEVIARIREYTSLLLQWNRVAANLVSNNDEGRVVSRHIQESLAPAHWLVECGAKRWVDFGSGGGFPAIPLVLAGVGERWTLVESRRTKTLFLRRVVQDLKLAQVEVVTARLEDVVLEESRRLAYDGFTSRATLTLSPTLKLAADVVAPGGHAFLWKGSRCEDEMKEDLAWQEHWEHVDILRIGDGHTKVAKFVRRA